MITKGKWDTFLTLGGEELLLVQRKHSFVVILPILFTSVSLALYLIGTYFFTIHTLSSIPLFIITTLLGISIFLSLLTKIIIDWYYHLYILTNRKILEIRYTPLASHVVNDVMLDKVDCTEIDLRVNGFVHELVGMGDVVITFDRPTHEEEFILKDIQHSGHIEKFLTRHLMDHAPKTTLRPMWFRRPSSSLVAN
jgi:hypothetical protein